MVSTTYLSDDWGMVKICKNGIVLPTLATLFHQQLWISLFVSLRGCKGHIGRTLPSASRPMTQWLIQALDGRDWHFFGKKKRLLNEEIYVENWGLEWIGLRVTLTKMRYHIKFLNQANNWTSPTKKHVGFAWFDLKKHYRQLCLIDIDVLMKLIEKKKTNLQMRAMPDCRMHSQ